MERNKYLELMSMPIDEFVSSLAFDKNDVVTYKVRSDIFSNFDEFSLEKALYFRLEEIKKSNNLVYNYREDSFPIDYYVIHIFKPTNKNIGRYLAKFYWIEILSTLIFCMFILFVTVAG